jgi:hypothetical protein
MRNIEKIKNFEKRNVRQMKNDKMKMTQKNTEKHRRIVAVADMRIDMRRVDMRRKRVDTRNTDMNAKNARDSSV